MDKLFLSFMDKQNFCKTLSAAWGWQNVISVMKQHAYNTRNIGHTSGPKKTSSLRLVII